MFILAQVLSFIAIVIDVITIQFKEKKNILIGFSIVNFIFAISFLPLGAYSGALISFISSMQSFINYIYLIKGKKLPKIFIPIYFLIPIICGVFTYNKYVDLLPIFCAILYVLIIIQKKEKYIRILTLCSIITWLTYEAFVGSYVAMISNACFAVSAIIAIIRYDVLKKEKAINN